MDEDKLCEIGHPCGTCSDCRRDLLRPSSDMLDPIVGLRTAGELAGAFAKLPRDTIVWGSAPVHGGTCYSECAIYPPGGKRDVALLELSKPVEWGIIT